MKESFFKLVHKAALPAIWGQGGRMAQADAVSLVEQGKEESTYRVRSPGARVHPTVVLYHDDEEWDCDCGSRNDPCEHVIAAACAAHAVATGKQTLKSTAESTPQLCYNLKRAGHESVVIERSFSYPDGRREPLSRPLATLVANSQCPAQPSSEDLAVDNALVRAGGSGGARQGQARGLSADRMRLLLRALSVSRNVTLDGKPVATDTELLEPRARVRDTKDGFELSLTAPRGIDEVLDRGLALSKGKLRPLAVSELTGDRLERLPLAEVCAPRDVGVLVTEKIPRVEKLARVEVAIETTRLPGKAKRLPPHIHFEFPHQGHTLTVLPTLAYGNPPIARIDADNLVLIGEGGDVPKRNRNAEKEEVLRLRDDLDLVPGRTVHFDGHEAGRFAKRLQAFQKSSNTSFARQVMSTSRLEARLDVEGTRFDLNFTTDDAEPRQASVEAVYRAWNDGLDVVPLADGGWAPLPVDWMERYGGRVADLLAARRPDGDVPIFAGATLADLCQELGHPPPPSFERLRPLLENFDKLPSRAIPEVVTATLRPYQHKGVDWLGFLREAGLGAVLADDMGLGKTLQTLCAIEGKTLVVCPRSVVFNWDREIEKFRPDLSVNVYHGPGRELTDADVTLTTYAVLRLDVSFLKEEDWKVIVLDEAQAIKNADSQAARAAFELSESVPETAFRLALTGTPVENHLDELWSIYRFTHPGLLGARKDFQERYGRPIQDGVDEAAERLRQVIKPFLLRRLKRDVAKDLPPRTDVVLTVELSEPERELYDAIHAAKQKEVIETLQGGGSVMAALEALLRLRQAACHPSLIPGQESDTSSKLEALLEAISEAAEDGHKCIVFSQWTSLLNLVEPELRRANLAWERLDGSTRDRAGVVERFQADDGPPVLISSLKAGGTGLNLTAADHVFLLDPWWNPAAEDQAADRAHRIGQTRPVTVYRMIARNTIEEGILELQGRKRAVADAALEAGGAAAGITRDDLLDLLRG